MNVQDMVREFHEVMGLGILDYTPGTLLDLPDEVRKLRQYLLSEEVSEYYDAEGQSDFINVAEELADIVYVVYGTALEYGIDLDKVIEEKHKSNMTKLDDNGKPIFREDGKIVKGPNFKPADTAKVLYE